MAIGVYKSKVSIPEIGINVASSNTKTNSLQSISNSYAQTSNLFFQAAGDEAKKVATEFGMSVPIEKVMGINGDTGMPEAYSLPENYGTIAMDAFKRVIDQRFFEAIENDYRAKAKELYTKYSLDVAGFENAFLGYTAEVVDVAQGKFKEFAREVGINQTKGYVANIRSNIYQQSLRKAQELGKKQDDELYSIAENASYIHDEKGQPNTNMQSSVMFDALAGYISSKKALIKAGIETQESVEDKIIAASKIFMHGRFESILSQPNLRLNELNSKAFMESIRLKIPNPALPEEAQEFILDILKLGVDADDIKKFQTTFTTSQGNLSAARKQYIDKQKLIADEKKKKKEDQEKIDIAKNQLNSEERVTERIDEVESRAAKIGDGFVSPANIERFITYAATIEEYIKTSHEMFVSTGEANGINKSTRDKKLIDLEKKLKLGITNAVNAIIKSESNKLNPIEVTSETYNKLKQNISNIISGQISPNQSILSEDGKESFNLLLEASGNNLKSKLVNFSLDDSLQNIEDIKAIKVEEEKKYIEQVKLNNEINMKKRFRLIQTNFVPSIEKELQAILTTIGLPPRIGSIGGQQFVQNRDNIIAINELKAKVKDAMQLKDEYNNQSILNKDEGNKLIQRINTDVMSKVLSDFILKYTKVSGPLDARNLNANIEHIELLQNYIDSDQSKELPVPEVFRKTLDLYQKTYGLNASDMRTHFNRVLKISMQELNKHKDRFTNELKYIRLQGLNKNVPPKDVSDILMTKFGTPGVDGNIIKADPFEFHNSLERIGDLNYYKMFANGNVGQGFIDMGVRLMNNPDDPTLPPDLTPYITTLMNISQFPLQGGKISQDLTPNVLKNNASFQKLLAVVRFLREDESFEPSMLKSALLNLKQVDTKTIEAMENNVLFGGKPPKTFNQPSRQEQIDKKVREVLGLKSTTFNRGTNFEFFDTLDKDLDIAFQLGKIKDQSDFETFIQNRYKERYVLSNKYFNNPFSIQSTNYTKHSGERLILDDALLKEAEDEVILNKVMPFFINNYSKNFQDELGFEGDNIIQQGFGIKFGDKIYASKDGYNEDNIIEIRMSPRVDLGTGPEETVASLENGFNYADISMDTGMYHLFADQVGIYNLYFKTSDMLQFLPLGAVQANNELDAITEHHYTNIASGKTIFENNRLSTVLATTIGISTDAGEITVLLPTLFDGKVYPVETQQDLESLIERAKKDRSLMEYPTFENPAEAEIWYAETKSKWKNIGNDKQKASTILYQNAYLINDIMSVNMKELAHKYNRLGGQRAFDKLSNDFKDKVGTDEEISENIVDRAIKQYNKRQNLNNYNRDGFRGVVPITGNGIYEEDQGQFYPTPDTFITNNDLLKELLKVD